jgi:hypothetical protein
MRLCRVELGQPSVHLVQAHQPRPIQEVLCGRIRHVGLNDPYARETAQASKIVQTPWSQKRQKVERRETVAERPTLEQILLARIGPASGGSGERRLAPTPTDRGTHIRGNTKGVLRGGFEVDRITADQEPQLLGYEMERESAIKKLRRRPYA